MEADIILMAYILDLLLGDPRWLPHPVRWMGNAIKGLEPVFIRAGSRELFTGLLFSVTLISGTWAATFFIIRLAGEMYPPAGAFISIILIFYAIASRSLHDAAMEVYLILKSGDLSKARRKVAWIVGRDTHDLNSEGVACATVETVAENLVDGIIAPLFYAFIGGAPLAMAYRMVNTLDSMIGYKNEKYHSFGKASARIDDIFNYIPARISVLLTGIAAWFLTGKKPFAMSFVMKEGKNHSSPNAGYPEAAFSAVMRVRLGGPNYYGGVLVEKPYIGGNFKPVEINDIRKSCELMMITAWVGLMVFQICSWIVRGWI